MKALVYTAPHKVEAQVHPDPSPKAGEVVVRVRAAGVCGSDLLGFLGKSKKRVPPLILGHEIGGEIVALEMAKVRGAERIFTVDVQKARLAVAERLGARPIHAKKVDPVATILEATGGQGCDVVVDAAGYSPTRQQGQKVVARGGVLGLV